MRNAVRMIFATAVFAGALAVPAFAGLPPVPGADKAPQAKASNAGEGGGTLEPYLVTWLLPIGGIVMAVAGIGMDRKLRAQGGG